MDKKSILILGFAIVAIGLFIIPSTMSMFMGQHRFYSVRTAESQYEMCERCHFAEVGEWKANTGAHAAYKARMTAETGDPGCFCHQINATSLEEFGISRTEIDAFNYEIFNETGKLNISKESWNWTNDTSWRSTATPHVAITIECISCHTNATDQLENDNEAHKPFFAEARNSLVGSNNTACMACHTMIGLNITMERVEGGLFINANHTENYNWTISVTTNNTRTSQSQYWPANVTNVTG
ncbi:MAG: hypothetical protein K8R34_06780 [Methanosarcinales archaeon]|nr:hypothetical protein [Methanosarcinales archaeon]MCD4809584.1 hypothetical protein [Methanosarcinales archaeon]